MASSSNFVDVSSVGGFEALLKKSEESGGLNVLFFWADWHEPCQLVSKIVEQLAKENPNTTFLKIEAEKVPDVTTRYPVSSVPTFVFVKAGKTLQVLENAPTHTIVAAVEKHSKNLSNRPPLTPLTQSAHSQSTTTPQTSSHTHSSREEEETPEQLNQRLSKLVNASPVMLFMKGSPDGPRCGFSKQIIALLKEQKVKFGYFDILSDNQVRQGLKTFSNWKTYPQLYISGNFVGGLDVINELISEDEFQEMLPEQGAASLDKRLEKLINQEKIMLFMKGSPDAPQCGFSRTIVELLSKEDKLKNFGHFDILTDSEVRQGLKEYSNWRTYPQLYIGGKLVGGLDVVRELQEEDELVDMVV